MNIGNQVHPHTLSFAKCRIFDVLTHGIVLFHPLTKLWEATYLSNIFIVSDPGGFLRVLFQFSGGPLYFYAVACPTVTYPP